MATSTFGKQFSVKAEKVKEFVDEMSKPATPTLQKSFHSHSVHLAQEKDLREKLRKVLNK